MLETIRPRCRAVLLVAMATVPYSAIESGVMVDGCCCRADRAAPVYSRPEIAVVVITNTTRESEMVLKSAALLSRVLIGNLVPR